MPNWYSKRRERATYAARDPLVDAATAGEVNLASWRAWMYLDVHEHEALLLSLLLQKTDFQTDHPARPLLAKAASGAPDAMREIAAATMDQDKQSDLACSWMALAACGGDVLAQQALLRVLIDRARKASGPNQRRLWRIARSWGPAVGLADLSGTGSASARLREALLPPQATHDDQSNPPEVKGDADSVIVLRAPIPVDSREDKALARGWEELRRPLRLAAPPPLEILETILLAEFPWLTEVIGAIVTDLRLQRWAGQPWAHWQPLLIVGPPGTGKTRLARRIAQLLNVGFGEVNAAGSADNRLLAGTARGWASASPSQVLHVMRQSRTANPVMLVDEIDKCRAVGRNGDIRDTLLSMLEPLSAANWSDECLMVQCDLSHVNWLLCCNDTTPLRGPLLTRVRVVAAPTPTEEHFPEVFSGIRRDIAARLGVRDADLPSLPKEVENTLKRALRRGISLRRIRAAVETAIFQRTGGGRPLH